MPSEGCRSSNTSSARTRSSVSSYRQVSTAPSHGEYIMTTLGASKVHSSNLLASSSKLKAPTKMDAEKMLHRSLTSNASTGGNGIRRPYGRFIASRGGLALSVWERQAPGSQVPHASSSRGVRGNASHANEGASSSLSFPRVKPAGGVGAPASSGGGRNVSKYNVKRKAYTSRNMDISSKSVESKYSFQGTDTINYSSSNVIDLPLFSRPRPEGMASLGGERSSSSMLTSGNSRSTSFKQLPSATFLTHIPTLPRAVRVDCGQSCAKDFLTRSPSSVARSPTAAFLGGGDSAVNLSSKSLKSLSSFGLPEVLSGALSLNINQLNNYQQQQQRTAAAQQHHYMHAPTTARHQGFSMMSTM
ncbi:hypothetical protein HOP50_10g58100 [Chloropicon primus]|uniref:Uncharacterized protein n=1 Tax=Chloropicon primus TaxID=1764295 RepID=A0A5B8MUV5_9CHLO|nr:hypothetical protein A3770_10p57900 [Chloropicon primus]UPR02484.1 hypothetical protein HOP50_10g58100 [Chloropicon primus]|eukprot:QDZ23272.1 hypothetical protein A3770_10p57900 [Chloropicon primus]